MRQVICDEERCTGCEACRNICPKHAINMRQSEEGFFYPEITDECVSCEFCGKVCPAIHDPVTCGHIYPKVYAAFNDDPDILDRSSSGGMFRLFADHWDGDVYGASMRENFTVHLHKAKSQQDLISMQGSKYVYSHTEDVYKDIKTSLDKGGKVLFFGLPCQVAGLRNFCGRDFEKLLCVDIVCHGTPSEKLFQDYLENEQKGIGKIDGYNATYKSRKWTPMIEKNIRIVSKDKIVSRDFTEDPYMWWFNNNWSFRPSCYQCKFADIYRQGDITIGDFFGLGVYRSYGETVSRGVSQVLINTKKGENFFNSLELKHKVERSLEEAMLGNPNLWKPTAKPQISDSFYGDYVKNGYAFLHKEYFLNRSRGFSVRVKKFLRKNCPRLTTQLMLLQRKKNLNSIRMLIRQLEGEFDEKEL